MAPAAVRIPDPARVQVPVKFAALGPQIFVHEGARQALERRFQLAFDGPVQLAVTDNRRRMVTHSQEGETLRIRVHMMFLDAPDRVQDALADYVVHGDRSASSLIGEFIHANSFRIRASRPLVGTLRTMGRVHDLSGIVADLADRYFESSIADVLAVWGRRTNPANRKRATIKLGSYCAAERLVRVHPVLDAEWVPRYFVSYIVFHELLHHVVPAVRGAGRTSLHPPEFIRRERAFRHYERALEWERKHIDRLLRSR
jgi:hypothetical protein